MFFSLKPGRQFYLNDWLTKTLICSRLTFPPCMILKYIPPPDHSFILFTHQHLLLNLLHFHHLHVIHDPFKGGDRWNKKFNGYIILDKFMIQANLAWNEALSVMVSWHQTTWKWFDLWSFDKVVTELQYQFSLSKKTFITSYQGSSFRYWETNSRAIDCNVFI